MRKYDLDDLRAALRGLLELQTAFRDLFKSLDKLNRAIDEVRQSEEEVDVCRGRIGPLNPDRVAHFDPTQLAPLTVASLERMLDEPQYQN